MTREVVQDQASPMRFSIRAILAAFLVLIAAVLWQRCIVGEYTLETGPSGFRLSESNLLRARHTLLAWTILFAGTISVLSALVFVSALESQNNRSGWIAAIGVAAPVATVVCPVVFLLMGPLTVFVVPPVIVELFARRSYALTAVVVLVNIAHLCLGSIYMTEGDAMWRWLD